MLSSNNLFKMLSLRGPDEDKFIDPSRVPNVDVTFVGEIPVSKIDDDEVKTKIREALARFEILTPPQLKRIKPIDTILASLDTKPSTDLRKKKIRFAGSQVEVSEFARTNKFIQDYGRIYNSWLASKLSVEAGLSQDHDLFEMLTSYVRTCEIIHRSSKTSYTPEIGALLQRTPIVYPKKWSRTVTKRSDGKEGVVMPTFSQQAKAIKKEREQTINTIEIIEDLQRVAGPIRYDPLFSEMTKRPIDATTIAFISGKLPNSKRPIGVEYLKKYEGLDLDQLTGEFEHDKNTKVRDANALCGQIRVFEDFSREKLPLPRKVSGDDRPSIKNIGIGDLIVARQNLERYEASEIAHIENVMPGEAKVREHERTTITEELFETETTEETFSERDFETSDRFELQTESSKTIQNDFSVEGGVNTSGKYGLTTVETSLEAQFSGSNTESNKTTMQTAQDITSKTVERVKENIRELRRRTTKEEIRELARHTLSNVPNDPGENPSAISGIYNWVDKVEKIQLRHFGTRLMIEFHIPEPGVSLLEQMHANLPHIPKPAPLAIGPEDIQEANYMCLAQLYCAEGIKPPPPFQKQAGISFASRPKADKGIDGGEVTFRGDIVVPDGYQPFDVLCTVSGRGFAELKGLFALLAEQDKAVDQIHAHVAVAGQEVLLEPKDDEQTESMSYSAVTNLTRPVMETGATGVPVTAVVSGHDESTATVNIQLWCYRSARLMDEWRLETYEKIKLAHRALLEDYEQEIERLRFQEESIVNIEGSPPEINRQIEKDELKKWSIKLMRVDHFEFDAIVGLQNDDNAFQEVDAALADEETPLVRFFETSFEWQHMSYFLYPYFWARRDSWNARLGIKVANDHRHELFLKAGYARVVVPVSPGREEYVLSFLNQDPSLEDIDRLKLVDEDVDSDFGSVNDPIWLELRANSDREIALGNGKLDVQADRRTVKIVSDAWKVSPIDVGREIFINAVAYEIASIDEDANQFEIDREFVGNIDDHLSFASGSVRYGEPWTVTVPTRLVILKDNAAALN